MMADLSAQAGRLRGLRGAVCARAQIGCAGALLLDFGTLGDPGASGYREAANSVIAEGPWRVDQERRVLVGSGGSAATAEHALREALGRAVLRVNI